MPENEKRELLEMWGKGGKNERNPL